MKKIYEVQLNFANGWNRSSSSNVVSRLVLVPTTMQQASAQDTNFNFEQEQDNKCSGFAECSREGTITFGGPVMDGLVSFPLNA